MSDVASPPERSSNGHKAGSRPRWRDKFFSSDGWRGKDGGDRESNDDEVDQFLGSSTSSTSKPKPPRLPVTAPRLDTISLQQPAVAPPESDLPPVQDTYRRPRPRLNKGLTVSFVKTAPIVIGEGGDDADLPVRELTSALQALRVDPDQIPLIRRRSTGFVPPERFDSRNTEIIPRAQGQQQDWLNPSAGQEGNIEHAGGKLDDEVEGLKAPRAYPSVTVHAPPDRANALFTETEPGPSIDSTGHAGPLESPYLGSSDQHDGSPSPKPPTQPRSSSLQPRIHQVSAEEARGTSHDVSRSRQRSPHQETSRGSSPSISQNQRGHNLRSVAKGFGTDALDEFDVRVQRLLQLFHVSVATQKEMTDIAFPTWVRAAAWWFLKGRQELEISVRNKSRSPRDGESSTDSGHSRTFMQAHVDLAKAWWIVKEITPQHPDLRKYGSASMPTMVAIIESFGQRDMAELVKVQIAIIANLRALTISMKRNERLPPQSFKIQGHDTQIFIDYPNLPQQIVNLDSESRSDIHKHQSSFALPIGDTEQHFILGRTFSKASLVYRNSGKEQARIICIISTIQRKIDGSLQALIASQDGQVRFSIAPDEEPGHAVSWPHVQWKNSSSTLAVPLSLDLDLHMPVSENDFRSIREFYEKFTMARRQCSRQENERLLYECVLRQFERLEMPYEVGAFPQGVVQDCRLRVFSRKLVTSGNHGSSSETSGLRMVILTPGSMKSFHVISTDLGGRNPILLGSCRPEEGPSLTIRTPDSPSLLAGFNSTEDLEKFRAVITQSAIAKEESTFPPLLLQNYTVSLGVSQDESPVDAAVVFQTLKWRQVQIVEQKVVGLEHQRSKKGSFRLLIDCGLGWLVESCCLSMTLCL